MFDFNTISVITLFGVVNGFCLSLIFWKTSIGINYANKFFSFCIGICAFATFQGFLTWSNLYKYTPHFLWLQMPFIFLIAPLMYLYIYFSINNKSRLEKKQILHFIPFIIFLFVHIPVFFQSGDAKINNIDAFISGNIKGFDIVGLSWFLSLIYTIVYLFKTKNYLKNNFNYTKNKLNPEWQKYIIYSYMVLYISGLITGILTFFGLAVTTSLLIFYIMGSMGMIVLFLILVSYPLITSHSSSIKSNFYQRDKYENSSLSDQLIDQYRSQLLMLLIEKQIYKDPELTLTKLAKEISISRNHLSQVINEKFNQNFYDFINSYRVDYIMEELKREENQSKSILEIAFEAGFNSKSSFNSFFKSRTGLTPSAYRKQSTGKNNR